MLPIAVTAALAATGPDLIDWSKATDDMRFALLKPVMTATEVERLKIGKTEFAQGCGQAKDDRGRFAPACVTSYSYTLTGRAKPVGIQFTIHGEFESPEDIERRVQTQVADRGRWQPPAPPAQSKWKLVSFRADGVLYRLNKDGLYVTESGKK